MSMVVEAPAATTGSGSVYRTHGKRALDLALCLLLLPVAAPTVAVLWALARRDGGPGLFGHVRLGRDGRAFRCWKIRTMRPDAELALARHLARNPRAAHEWRAQRKLEGDPRVTPLGRVLRRTGLDELPQLWNVLRGEMSLVGPRPVTGAELACYGDAARDYLRLRPGITGLWQVAGRDTGAPELRGRLDRAYAARLGLWSDLRILAQTPLALARQPGS